MQTAVNVQRTSECIGNVFTGEALCQSVYISGIAGGAVASLILADTRLSRRSRRSRRSRHAEHNRRHYTQHTVHTANCRANNGENGELARC